MNENKSQVESVYSAQSVMESETAYNGWATSYEKDIFSYQSRFPFVTSAVFTRFVKPGDGPILDAGCGTGLQIEPISLAGYENIIGIDLSARMLEVAKSKNMYESLHQMTLGERLDFETDQFAHTLSSGTITPGHAPPHSFKELIRVTRPGGYIIFSLRTDDEVDPSYPAILEEYEKANLWKQIFKSKAYAAMPAGESNVLTTAFAYIVL
ncbi:MAG: SAM-dependent methyltransferase [marine bacterium B5-7]|nr:MAG: SAM-dependent methyltransferase [marine bacterium B5-7]